MAIPPSQHERCGLGAQFGEDSSCVSVHAKPDQRHRHRRQERREPPSHVRVDIGNGQTVTSSITNESVDELGIKAKSPVIVVVKASDVMIAVN